MPKPTNLKVLPQDISGEDLVKTMMGFRAALGVQCNFCHAQNPETKRMDYASDANPVKANARIIQIRHDEGHQREVRGHASRPQDH